MSFHPLPAACVAVALVAATGCSRGAIRHPSQLHRAFARAARSIAAGQETNGNFATPRTTREAFRDVTRQWDVYTPSVLVDLLEPVRAETGLTGVVDRTVAYLREQILPSGFVIYYGRRSALGPDWDDTSLVWRVAPLDDGSLLRKVLDALSLHRRPDGLYLTWIEPSLVHENLPSRSDRQNIVDIDVQIHILLFLAQHDRDAAARLCEAIRGRVHDAELRGYYERAPILPLWRSLQAREFGCDLPAADTQLDELAPGQEPWLQLMQLFCDLAGGGDAVALREPLLQALAVIARNDFAMLEENPLMMYHTDYLRRGEPEYHFWSKEVSLALWLRVYVEAARRCPDWPLPATPAVS